MNPFSFSVSGIAYEFEELGPADRALLESAKAMTANAYAPYSQFFVGASLRLENGKVVEVKVHWHDSTSPKGVKIKKSLAELSDYCIIMYVAKNFTIRDILFLDSEFILRKFDTKGHTIFLKDQDVASYFFSKSDKHFDKVVNKTALLKFASPTLALKLEDRLK
jgi:hypothetical protein